MKIEDIESSNTKSLKTKVKILSHALSVISASIGIGSASELAFDGFHPIGVCCILGCDDNFASVAFDVLAEELLRGSIRVGVGRIEKIASLFSIGVVHFSGHFRGAPERPVFTEGHATEAERGHAQARTTEKAIGVERGEVFLFFFGWG